MYNYGSNVVKRFRNNIRNWAIQHKMEIRVEILRYDESMIEEVEKLYTETFGKKPKMKTSKGKDKRKGKDFYDALSIKAKRGETTCFYFYHNGKVEARIWTHRNDIKEKLLTILGGRILREMKELYVRYHERSEKRVIMLLEAIMRKYGTGRNNIDYMHKRKMINYLHRLYEFEYRGLKFTAKTYRHRSYSSKDPSDPEYHPKLEIAVIKQGALDKEDIQIALALLNTIVKLAKLKQIWSEYDREQHQYPLTTIDPVLYRILKGTAIRVKAIHVLGKEYYDLNHAILDLLARGLSIRDIARVLLCSHVAVLKRVRRLAEQGYVKKEGRKYVIAKKYRPNDKPIPMELKRFIEERFTVKSIDTRTLGTVVLETAEGYKVMITDMYLRSTPIGDIPAKVEIKGIIRQFYIKIEDGKLKLSPVPFQWERTGGVRRWYYLEIEDDKLKLVPAG